MNIRASSRRTAVTASWQKTVASVPDRINHFIWFCWILNTNSLHDWKSNIILVVGRVNNGNRFSLFGLFIRLNIVILFYRSPDMHLSKAFRQMSLSFQRVWETVWRRKWSGRRLHRLDNFNKVLTHLIWLFIHWHRMLILCCVTGFGSGFKCDLTLEFTMKFICMI